MNISIVYEDNHVLGISKPAGMLSQGDRTGDESVVTSMKAYLKQTYDKPGNVYLGLVHRLDLPVSGAMILARTSKAARRLSKAFRERVPRKTYVALIDGRLHGQGYWEDAMVKVKRTARIVSQSSPGAKQASLTWQALAVVRAATLVRVQIHTGRPHQIRCQFAHRGYPLLGDVRYGAQRMFDGRNLALHSYQLTIPHPVRPTPLIVTAPMLAPWRPWVAKTLAGLEIIGTP